MTKYSELLMKVLIYSITIFLIFSCENAKSERIIEKAITSTPTPLYKETRMLGTWDVYKDVNHTDYAGGMIFSNNDTVYLRPRVNSPDVPAYYQYSRQMNSMFISYDDGVDDVIMHSRFYIIDSNEMRMELLNASREVFYLQRKQKN